MREFLFCLPLLALAACQVEINKKDDSGKAAAAASSTVPAQKLAADPLAARDAAPGASVDPGQPDAEGRPLMQAQVVLDRLGFTPGVVDGKPGMSTRNAIVGFQTAKNLQASGEIDQPTQAALKPYGNIPATRVVTIPADFAAGPFLPIPRSPQEQAKLPALGYESLDEKLAERFHTTVETLKLLNPGGVPAGSTASPSAAPSTSPSASAQPSRSFFHAGQSIRVPNVGADTVDPASVSDKGWAQTLASLGVSSTQPKVAKIVVSKSKGTLSAFDEGGKLVAVYTATMGSTHDPLPLGEWKVQGISHNPKFHYNPALFWDAKATDRKALLPAGPNGPVGVVWIDLNIPHYGIHGTPRPETIGRAESHGCVRLTNWDAARLAQMVHAGTAVSFEA